MDFKFSSYIYSIEDLGEHMSLLSCRHPRMQLFYIKIDRFVKCILFWKQQDITLIN